VHRQEHIGEVLVAIDDQGAGPAVVMLHPFPFDSRIWAENTQPLIDAGYRVIALDYPGFGDSPAPPNAMSIEQLGDLLGDLLEALKIETAALVGLSMGGYVALAFANRFPGRLWALVLADTRAAADGLESRQGRAAALGAIAEKGVGAYLRQSLPRLVGPVASPEFLARLNLLAEKRELTLTTAIEALRDRPDRRGELARIPCPTLVLVGTQDQVSPPNEMREIAAAIPGARYIEIGGASHLSNIEAPGDFNHAVVDFLRGVSAVSTRGSTTP
jgi:pimeloyl-ACP methyl ester carboxylesterase